MAVAPGQRPGIGPGTILYVESDKDYAYGVGPLALRLVALDVPPGRITEGQWINVRGHRIGADGRVDTRTLQVAIKAHVLLASVKPPGFIPPATRP